MQEKTIYEPGYYIRATTWENDGDNYNTKERFYKDDQHTVDMIALVVEKMTDNNIGNFDHYNNEESEQYKKFVHDTLFDDPRYRDFVTHNPNAVNIVDGHLWNLGFGSEDFALRVCESLEIFYIEKPITIKARKVV